VDVLGGISRSQVEPLIKELADRLSQQGVYAHLRLIGGSALLLQDVTTRLTHDIDAVPPVGDPLWNQWPILEETVNDIGGRYGLGPQWLNKNAAMFVPANAEWETIICSHILTLEVASVETLLAMKVCSDRRKDVLDIRLLLQRLGLQGSPESAIDLTYRIYGDDPVNLNHDREYYLSKMQAICDSIATGNSSPQPQPDNRGPYLSI